MLIKTGNGPLLYISKFFSLFFIGALFVLCPLAWVAPSLSRAEVPSRFEADYSEAVILFNNRKYKSSQRVLNALIGKAPQTVEFLELKALILKAQKKDKNSLKVYESLIRAKKAQGADNEALAPYFFELGVIYYRQKNDSLANKFLEKAIDEDFNSGAAHFFMGMIAFKNNQFSEADDHFSEAAQSDAADLVSPSYFYLGQIHLKTGYKSGATQSFLAARDTAEHIMNDSDYSPETQKIAKKLYETTVRALQPMDQSRAFATVGILGGYDSNTSAIPDTTSGDQSTGKESARSIITGGVGWMSSPLGFIQFVPSYRFSNVFNFNDQAQGAEYFTHIASIYLTRHPLHPVSYGLKLEGTWVFKNQDADTNEGRLAYQNFQLSYGGGPYFKFEIIRRWFWGIEATGLINDYGSDDSTTNSAYHRSGHKLSGKTFLQHLGGDLFNPLLSAEVYQDETNGSEFRAMGYVASLTNTFILTPHIRTTFGLSYGQVEYKDRESGKRTDNPLGLSLSGSFRIRPWLTLLGNILYLDNQSTVTDTYQFQRFTVDMGLNFIIL